ncbi:MAG: tRNA 4-thiouridine(8) synthase ThiI [Lachnospiraceae bacterium]|nr:tRNA 4-thiouridine(8) synthase ThiI [Lachnospiraceae bacterium]
MFRAFLLKYGEIFLKGKNRYIFEDALVEQVRLALKSVDGEFDIHKNLGRVYVEAKTDFDYDETVEALKRVFGVLTICPVLILENDDFEYLKSEVVKYIGETYAAKDGLTFKVFCKRARKNYPLNSMEMNMAFGEVILENYPEMKVDVHKPEVELHVEIRERIYIYSILIPGPGGMPVGTAGKAMVLLSGGLDSPVAAYQIAKRGVRIEAVYFHAPPYTSERAKQKVVDLAAIVSKYTGPVKLHIINFTDIQMSIYEKCPHDELTVIMRRYMMRIAEAIANEDECLGLVTGESIGQVASQTMYSLACTDDVTNMPVYRPLIAMDKVEIIDIAERIGTYETSILPFEDCCTIFVAKHPVTKPKVSVIAHHEERLGEEIDEMVRKAIEEREIVVAE